MQISESAPHCWYGVCCTHWTVRASRTCDYVSHPEASCALDFHPNMTDGAVCSSLLKPTAFVSERHPGESKDQLRGCSDSRWLLCPEASSKAAGGRLLWSNKGGKIQRSKTHLTEPIRPVASLIHPQCFVLPPLSLWITLIDMTIHWQRTGLTSGLLNSSCWSMYGTVKRGDVAVFLLCHVDPEFEGLRNAVLRRYSLTLGFQEGIVQLVLIRLQS